MKGRVNKKKLAKATGNSDKKKEAIHKMVEALINDDSKVAGEELSNYLHMKTRELILGEMDDMDDMEDEDMDDMDDMEDEDDHDDEDMDDVEDEDEDDHDDEDMDDVEDEDEYEFVDDEDMDDDEEMMKHAHQGDE